MYQSIYSGFITFYIPEKHHYYLSILLRQSSSSVLSPSRLIELLSLQGFAWDNVDV